MLMTLDINLNYVLIFCIINIIYCTFIFTETKHIYRVRNAVQELLRCLACNFINY